MVNSRARAAKYSMDEERGRGATFGCVVKDYRAKDATSVVWKFGAALEAGSVMR